MGLISLLFILVVVGVVLWLINTYLASVIDGKILKIINVVVVVAVVIWLLTLFFGPIGNVGNIHVGR
jgi:Na+-translocating ferredoxin:NAD+ oxidoreductase RnfA subunit